MAETTNLEVVTPSAIIVSDPVEMVVVPGSDGQIGALPRHSKVISTLDRGLVDIYNDNKISSQIMIDGGIVEINETKVICDENENFCKNIGINGLDIIKEI